MRVMTIFVFALGLLSTSAGTMRAESKSPGMALPPLSPPATGAQAMPGRASSPGADPAGYVLGPGDQISLRVPDVDEINDKPVSVDLNGYIHIPLAGSLRAAGLTVQQLESEIEKHLSSYVRKPDVTLSIVEFHSQPVSVIGAVRNPGTLQLRGRKTLLEILSEAGGLDSANAGSVLKITRRSDWGPIPLPNATMDPSEQFSVAQLNLKSLLAATHPEENILIKPYDVISVPHADTVYVIGEVMKAGGFLLNDSSDVTVLQALSMAGGLDKMAKQTEARILRRSDRQTERIEIPVNIKAILTGKTPDLKLDPGDILFVPNNLPKKAALRAIEAAVQVGTGIAVFSRP